MRVLQEFMKSQCKITLFHWNNRYIIKIEKDGLEQTFKVNQFDVDDERDIPRLIDTPFMEEVLLRFDAMFNSLHQALSRL